jgi:HSP20 family protein
MATLTRYNGFGNALDLMTEMRRHFGLLLDEGEGEFPAAPWAGPGSIGDYYVWPRVTLTNAGDNFELKADVPGMTDKDVTVSIDQGVISIQGERKAQKAESRVKFERRFSLPAEVDAEQATATVQHGVLTVVLPKAAAVKPRQIEVKAG